MATPYDQGPERKGLHPIFSKFWVFKLYIYDFLIFYADFGRILPIFGDLEPDLRPDLGRKLG
jgi:hypothetical protein